jgi:hypothetical protein
MFKFVFLLCLLIAATLYTLGGRTDAPLRDGLAGKLAPLVYKDPRPAAPQPADLAAAGDGPAPVSPQTAPAQVPAASIARTQPQPAGSSVISAAFATAEAASEDAQAAEGLTLELPLVEPAPPRAAVAEAVAEPVAEPVALPAPPADATPRLQYVVADTVNVRAGPSAKTDSLTKLDRGEAVQVLPSDTPGWSMIRLEGDGVEGYVATRFLGGPPSDGIFTPVD